MEFPRCINPIVAALWFGLFGCVQTPVAADPDLARRVMVRTQLEQRDITSPRVLEAMRTVPRHEFVPEALRERSYEDTALPIGHGQTISQPYIVALMTQHLAPEPNDRVLEIGTGSGYQTAVLSRLVKEVYSVEIVEPLARQAAADLQRLGFNNVHVNADDGYKGWPEHAPFDSIIVTCAPDHVPQPLVEQLREGGRMAIPVGERGRVQKFYLFRKKEGQLEQQQVLAVQFVPMTRSR